MDWNKISGLSGVGSFVLAAAALSFTLWTYQPSPSSQGVPAVNWTSGMPAWILPGALGVCILLAAILHVIAARLNSRSRTIDTHAELTSGVKEADCPDKWLHDIAENQRRAIDEWVRVVDCRVHAHELLREDPYVEFIFYVHNDSVYRICVADTLAGSISFGSRQLNAQMRWRENPIKDMSIGARSYFIIQQPLSREDVIYILNSTSGNNKFDFAGFEVTVTGGPDFKKHVIPKRLNIYPATLTNEELLNNYPKLNIELLQATYSGYWDGEHISDRALLVNVYVRLTNPRPVQVDIRKFKLSTDIHGKAYVAYAESGEIYEGRHFNDEGVALVQGRNLKNLSPAGDSPLTVEHDQARDGWLQFVLNDRGYDGDEPDPLPATLTIFDVSGEMHPAECHLKYKTG